MYSFYEHQNGPQEWNDYMLPTKRQHVMLGNTGHIFPSVHPTFYEYQSGGPTTTHSEPFSNLLDKVIVTYNLWFIVNIYSLI